jgi:hypothetical protein
VNDSLDDYEDDNPMPSDVLAEYQHFLEHGEEAVVPTNMRPLRGPRERAPRRQDIVRFKRRAQVRRMKSVKACWAKMVRRHARAVRPSRTRRVTLTRARAPTKSDSAPPPSPAQATRPQRGPS